MKKLIMLLAAVCTLSFVTSCNTKKEKEQEAQDPNAATIDSLRQALAQSQNESSDMFETLSQIQDGFDQINEAEGIVNVENRQGEKGNKQRIIDNMTLIQNKLKLNRELIANLQQQLRASNQSDSRTKAKLEEMVANFNKQLEDKSKEIEDLRAQLAEKDIKIAEQGEQINALNTNVSDLTQKNEEKARTVAAQDKELNTAYYVFGTKRELREQRILQRGDVLKNNDFNKDYFTRIDLRVTRTIRLYSKSAKLMTSHPASSYSLDKDAQGQYTLRITNPQAFWSVSKYLVITVK
uniref:Cbp1 family collagen-binding glycoprotein adhesin n=1 Tax=Prevotellamassilia timonensis TaxID=1852370 RepID=UPI0040389254